MFFLLVCKKVKVLPMFPGGPSEMIEDVQKVSCPSELTEGQNQTIQVWDLNNIISSCPKVVKRRTNESMNEIFSIPVKETWNGLCQCKTADNEKKVSHIDTNVNNDSLGKLFIRQLL